MIRALLAKIRAFSAATGGVAAVEFALVLPILLFVYVGSFEASQLIIADRRVTTVAGTLGDLVARSKDSITAATLNNYFGAASLTMGPMSTVGLTQVVSVVNVDADGVAKVAWSRAYPAGTTARTVDSVYDMSSAPQMLSLAKGKSVIVAEAGFTYHPLANLVFHADIPLSRTNFYLPRFEGTISCC